MKKRGGREFYEALCAEVDRGESVREVARRHSVEPKTLSWWRWKLRKDSEGRKPKKRTTPSSLVPVIVRDPVGREERLVELSVGGCCLAFESGTDPAYIAALVQALVASC